jgi:hypothetical protein
MEGLLLATTNMVMARARHPERLNATFLMVSAIPQVVASYLLPVTVIPRFGADAGFAILGAMAAVGTLVAFMLGKEIEDAPPRKPGTPVWTAAVLIGLCGVLLQSAANGAGWEYQARIGENLHFSGQVVGVAISADLVFQIIGTFAVAAIAWRLPFKVMLLASTLIQTAILITMGNMHAPFAYIAMCAIFGMMWLGMIPYQVSLLIDLDKTRQVVLVLASLQLIGLSAGPLICSFFVSPGNVVGAFRCAAVMALVAFALYLLAIVVANVTPMAPVEKAAAVVK